MDELLHKLNKWHILKEQHAALVYNRRKEKVVKMIKEIKATRNIEMLLDLLKSDADKCEDLQEFLCREFRRAIRLNNPDRVSSIIECFVIVGFGQEDLRESLRHALIEHLDDLCSKIVERNVCANIEVFEKLNKYDMCDGMVISKYIKQKIDVEIAAYMDIRLLDMPAKVDRWLNEMKVISNYKPEVIELYREMEIRYLLMSLEVIVGKNTDMYTAEDVEYLIKKIVKRSITMGVDIKEDIDRLIRASGIGLDEEIIKTIKKILDNAEE
ncbi:hypothetical protein CWI42_040420 [Ordospora colligata]|uniref:Uncharacterized protein n=1 Tax=Ordospora colligata OC4 TaxID=1354746 RepID=A0A0B2UKU0_9MICR|nr:uncharacterized protein M896_040420 [Ordospora colligata OC4]KHN69849.1 hypothetical protein M896_040420 [Ordospora colligata OC4]TBU16019.1 hypothetical protein CWI41_040420 [Ordospora colligata]TBU16232.1 hypothetical protein CWI40_040420 [Ordospora colligata]TBU18936.1 hypothetical protein CWI42_040420 [Ordospora colligata]